MDISGRTLNSLHFSSHSEWSGTESRNLFQAKWGFSTHGACPELISGFGRNDMEVNNLMLSLVTYVETPVKLILQSYVYVYGYLDVK